MQMNKQRGQRWFFVYLSLFLCILFGVRGSNGATLIWDSPAGGDEILHYTVYIDPSPAGYIPAPLFTNRFSLDNLPGGTMFTLHVTASSLFGESLPSTIQYMGAAAPTITVPPSSKQVAAGGPLELVVEASGGAPLYYQWMFNDSALPSQTNQTLYIASVTTENAGNYTVRVTNSLGSATSSPAAITVLDPPTIIAQPTPQSVAAGSLFQLWITATGTSPLSYRWFRNGQEIPGAQKPSYEVFSASSTNAGTYFIRVTNPVGNEQSESVVVTVQAPPVITAHPQSVTVSEESQITLAVTAEGSSPLSYQWYKAGTVLVGRTAASLVIADASSTDAGTYTVRVSNSFGFVESNPATVIVQPPGTAPTIIASPQPQTLAVGSPLTLEVLASGTAPLIYQWSKDGTNLPGQTSSTFSLSAAGLLDTGLYVVVVSNSLGAATSAPANVSILIPPSIVSHPVGTNLATGGRLTLSVETAGSLPLTYEWYRNSQLVGGADSATLVVPSATANDAGTYQVRISNPAGSILSREVTVSIAIAPQVTQQPSNTTVNEGGTLHLSFQVTGTGPLSVEWLRDDLLVQVTDVPELQISDVKPSDAGSYVARVTGPGGTTATLPISVQVETKPVITSQPQSAALPLGANITLTVAATGNGPFTYQWLKDGQIISGADTIFLVVSLQSDNDFGRYTVRVANSVGFTESQPGIIQKAAPPTIILQPQGRNVLVGDEFTLEVEAGGPSPFGYQWFRDGSLVTTATSEILSVSSASAQHSGTYYVVVTNSFGSIRSASATIRVVPHIVIHQQPEDTSVAIGTRLTLSVAAESQLPLSYQWFHNGLELEGKTEPSLIIANVATNNAGAYHAIVINELEELATDNADVTIIPGPDTSGGILEISAEPSGVSLVGQGVAGATYEIQVCSDLAAGNWTTVQTVVADENGGFEINRPTGNIFFLRTMKR